MSGKSERRGEQEGAEDGSRRGDHRMGDRPEKATDGGEKYSKTRTVMVEVKGEDEVTALEMLRAVRKECGVVLGCRARGDARYEVTMATEEGKTRVMDGIKVGNSTIAGKDMRDNELTVSFLTLPVYIPDEMIVRRLNEWGVTAVSGIRRRMWPGTEVVDGTRYLRVRFTEEVKSLPYSTRFQTIEGVEHFRVIHDRQERVCRLCIRPGHIFKECPEFRCHRCAGQGHYARECMEGKWRQQDGEERDDGMGEEERRRNDASRSEEGDERGREEGDDDEREKEGDDDEREKEGDERGREEGDERGGEEGDEREKEGDERGGEEGDEELMREEEEGEKMMTGETTAETKTTENIGNSRGEGREEREENGGEGGEARKEGASGGAGGGEGGIETRGCGGNGPEEKEKEPMDMTSGTTDSEESTEKVKEVRKRPMGKTRRAEKPKKKAARK